jgi:hypothetical protein
VSALIDADRLDVIWRDCAPERQVPTGTGDVIVTDGIFPVAVLYLDRLKAHEPEIRRMLGALPEEFRDVALGGKGGWSFLNGCLDRDGDQWGEQPDVNRLFTLGLGLRLVVSLLPRELWPKLPGSVPYYMTLVEATPRVD